MPNLLERVPRPVIGLLPIGHFYYWDQFPELREMGIRMYDKLKGHLKKIGDIAAPELVDTMGKAKKAGRFFREKKT